MAIIIAMETGSNRRCGGNLASSRPGRKVAVTVGWHYLSN